MVASMSSGAWLRPYTIKRSLMRRVPAEGVTILAPNVRLLSSGLCQ
ncbi:Uncharacterised protein [Mycobacterium tuberculosis]|nr:Uncharacterised protein [Mycobacterium tuberculosis]